MILHIQYDPKNRSGKGKMMHRLAPELEKLGVKVQYKRKGADVTLGLTKWRGKTAKKRVLRIDGIHLINNKKRLWNNSTIKKSILSADAVIYQSEWARWMINNIFNIRPNSYVVFNGANPDDYKNPIESPYPKNIILSAKWKASDDRRQKRLPEMYEIAKEYIKINSDVCFWIAGAHDMKDERIDQIKWLGHLEDRELARYLAMADVMLNIAWWDWCPNAVIEAICANCVIIGANQTGLAEITEIANGIIIPIDEPFRPRVIFPNNKPPKFDHSLVYPALDEAFKTKRKMNIEPFKIDNIALQYYQVFKDVLK